MMSLEHNHNVNNRVDRKESEWTNEQIKFIPKPNTKIKSFNNENRLWTKKMVKIMWNKKTSNNQKRQTSNNITHRTNKKAS